MFNLACVYIGLGADAVWVGCRGKDFKDGLGGGAPVEREGIERGSELASDGRE